MPNEPRAKTVSQVIAQLQKLPQDLLMYFDCPHCGRANIFSSVHHAAVIETTSKIDDEVEVSDAE